MEKTKFFAARTVAFPQMTGNLSFDVYVRIGHAKYTKVFQKGHSIDRDRLSGYMQKGTEYFYIPEEERRYYLDKTRILLDGLRRDGHFAREDAHHLLDEVTEQCLLELKATNAFDDKSAGLVATLVSSYVEIATHQPKILAQLIKLARSKPHEIKHAILTAIFATLLARAHEPKNSELHNICGIAGLLHDIGFSLLSPDLDEHSLKNTRGADAEIRKHPQYGAQIVSASARLPTEVRTAIVEHHESFDGTGYPKGLVGEKISLPARVIAIADAFVALTTGTRGSAPLPVFIALHALSRSTKLDPNLYATFTKMLKV